jgi:hypothetical protein
MSDAQPATSLYGRRRKHPSPLVQRAARPLLFTQRPYLLIRRVLRPLVWHARLARPQRGLSELHDAHPLTIRTEPVETVFDLLGSAENDLTYAVGWALARGDGFAEALMAELFPNGFGDVLGVSLQRFGPDRGYIDIEIAATRAHVIIEAKKEWAVPDEVQLRRYSERPAGDVAAVMLSLSASNRDWALKLLKTIAGVPVDHRSWSELAAIADTCSRRGGRASRRLLRDLVQYLKGASRVQNVSSNWTWCVVLARKKIDGLDGDLMDLPVKHRVYFHPYAKGWPRVPPNYIAFCLARPRASVQPRRLSGRCR